MAGNGTTVTARTLKVPGATLHYEVRGSGPVLLMIPGGPMDAGGFGPLADRLADRYTVVTYDCRGNSRSPLDGPPDDLGVEVHADDAHRLLAAVGTEPAYVLGSSGGATYSLDLAARYPDQVKTLVAHEPPVMELLPDSARWRALTEEIMQTYESDGVFAALQKFGEGTGMGGGPDPSQEISPEIAEMMSRTMGNMELFVSHLIPQISGFVPDIDALRSGSTRVVVGVGDESTKAQLPYRTAHALADRLGSKAVQFPGDHGGFGAHADAFAEKLHDVLR
jgi:pimeloyl-ACP methyl ester carboxylesterase